MNASELSLDDSTLVQLAGARALPHRLLLATLRSMAAVSAEEMITAVSRSLRERTGRSLGAWVDLVARDGPDPLDQGAVRRWLKEQHGLGQNSQWAVADAVARSAGWVPPTVQEYVDGQYRGAKAAQRGVYDALAAQLVALGDDVSVEGRSSYVPFVRGRQFAAVAASTRSRVDLGLRFTAPPASNRLTPARNFAQATHLVALTSADQVDDEVRRLMRTAYEQSP